MTVQDKAMKSSKNNDYIIHSFGYGASHDEKMLSSIKDYKNGRFYYIKNNEIVDECFLDCLGQLMSVIGKKAEILIKTYDKVKFVTCFESAWD